MVCCPRTHPYLSANEQECSSAPSGGDTSDLAASSGARRRHARSLRVTHVCHSGNHTGDPEVDEAVCDVVSLRLANNNLVGQLPNDLFTLERLYSLSMEGNQISGQLPDNVTYAVRRLNLRGNALKYPPPSNLLASCLAGNVACQGYPPESCDAFGANFVPRTDVATSCIECQEVWVSIVLTAVLVSLFFVALAGYAYFMTRHEGVTTQGVSTIAIIITHLQTVYIVSKLRLAWPASTKALFTFLVVDGLNLEGARPECLWRDVEEPPPLFFLFSIMRVATPLALLLSVASVRTVLAHLWARGIIRKSTQKQQDAIDKLERLETLVFSLPLTGSWRGAWELIRARNTGADTETRALAAAGGGIAIALLVFQALFMVKYGFYNYLVQQLEAEARKDVAQEQRNARDRKTPFESLAKQYVLRMGLGSRALERMRRRTSYTCKRFGDHAPFWQFVLWARQGLLTLVTLMPSMLAQGNAMSEADFIRGAPDRVLAAQVISSLILLLVFAGFHWRVKPFGFKFQNWLEMWLLGASFMIIFLAMLYSVTKGKASGLIVEAILTSALLLSLAASGIYLVIHYRSFLRERGVRRLVNTLKRRMRSSADFFANASSRSTISREGGDSATSAAHSFWAESSGDICFDEAPSFPRTSSTGNAPARRPLASASCLNLSEPCNHRFHHRPTRRHRPWVWSGHRRCLEVRSRMTRSTGMTHLAAVLAGLAGVAKHQ